MPEHLVSGAGRIGDGMSHAELEIKCCLMESLLMQKFSAVYCILYENDNALTSKKNTDGLTLCDTLLSSV